MISTIENDPIPEAIVRLKGEFVRSCKGRGQLLEVVPLQSSKLLPIQDSILDMLHRFAEANSIYVRSYDVQVLGVPCRAYEGDINSYWLSSKKHDTSYQPFYPTWLLSAYALARAAKSLGFEQVVDVGSGDGRIAYCAHLLGMGAHGIEIDGDLVQLQKQVSLKTGAGYNSLMADATTFDYSSLGLSKPVFFISGLPEMGEMLANSVIGRVLSIEGLKHSAGFNFTGSHVMKPLSRDQTKWGWGQVIDGFGLAVAGVVTLPTQWTADRAVDTAYVFARCR